jgi:hypothetical protein
VIPTSSPTFAGLTLTGFSGVLKATAGVISSGATLDDSADGTSTTMRTNLNADQLDGLHASGLWLKDTSQTGLTGDKSGSFNVTTTGTLDTSGLTISALTANRLTKTNASKGVVSVAALTDWVGGTTNEISVTDDGDGSVTVALSSTISLGNSI